MKDKQKDIPLKVLKAGNIICTIYGSNYGYILSKDGQEVDRTKNQLLQIQLDITNLSNKRIIIDSTFFKLTSTTGQPYPYAIEMDKAMQSFQHNLLGAPLQPGETQKGFITFQVPDVNNYRLSIYSGAKETDYWVFKEKTE